MDKRSLKKLIKLLNNFPEILDEKSNEIMFHYMKKGKGDIEYIARSVIDRFYEDYDPHKYNRWGDLYNVFKVTINQKVWKIDYSPKYMQYPHNVSNEYIYTWSFIMGYHGGAFDGPNHPQFGTPYYRTFPSYRDWSYPAERASFSPYAEIEERVKSYLVNVDDELNNDFRKMIEPYMLEITEQVKKTFKK